MLSNLLLLILDTPIGPQWMGIDNLFPDRFSKTGWHVKHKDNRHYVKKGPVRDFYTVQ